MKKIKNYLLEEQIGVGKFGIVFKGKNLDTDEPVAIKLIKKSLLNNQIKKELLLSEVKVMEKLKTENNQHIVKLIEFIETARNCYFILEYCDGGDLKQYLSKTKKLEEENCIKKFKEILNGIKILIKNQIIHRDLKTANIFIHEDNLKIGDFGFASDDMTDMLKLGTPLYMAPELLNNEKYSDKVDVWSLGVILYQMLVGDFPFKASSEQKLKEIVLESITFDENLKISSGIKELLKRMLDPNQETRISISELLGHPLFSNENPGVGQSTSMVDSVSSQKYSISSETTDQSDSAKEVLSNLKSINLQSLQSNALQQQENDGSGSKPVQVGMLFPMEINQETIIMNLNGGEQECIQR